jgi:hypothetical protein
MATNTKQTGTAVAKKAAQALNNKGTSAVQKTLAAAALAQSRTGKQTGAKTEDVASKALADKRSSPVTKQLAASVLAQSNKKR